MSFLALFLAAFVVLYLLYRTIDKAVEVVAQLRSEDDEVLAEREEPAPAFEWPDRVR